MSNTYFEEKVFETIDYTKNGFTKGTYEGCGFVNCNFSGVDLASSQFIDCRFTNSNLSMAKMGGTVINNVQFNRCKMLGINFETCNAMPFSFVPEDCILHFSSFYKMKLKKMVFKNCSLHEADFTQTDLTSAVFDNCDLKDAKFENTILEKADFRTAFNYSLDPRSNRVKKALFSLPGVTGLLDSFDIDIEQ